MKGHSTRRVGRDRARAAMSPAGGEIPARALFRIGEVATIVGVKAHVLRTWEGALGVLSPMKTRGSHRQYRRRDVEVALVVRHLLEVEGYTLDGARRRLVELGLVGGPTGAPRPGDAALSLRADLLSIRAELVALREGLGEARDGDAPGGRRGPVARWE